MKHKVSMLHAEKVPYRIAHSANENESFTAFFAKSNHAFELNVLKSMSENLRPGDLFVDIGANIGNHTLYIAALGCNVAAFEPNPLVADLLEESIKLNEFGSRVDLFKVGCGFTQSEAKIVRGSMNNLGGWRLRPGSDTDIPGDPENRESEDCVQVVTLDSIEFKQPVKVLKVDVEHMEYDVFRGAKELISRDHPLLYFECHSSEEMRPIYSFLESLGYYYHSSFNHITHLFAPSDPSTTDRDIIQRLQYQLFNIHYAARLYEGKHQHLLKTMNDKLSLIETALSRISEK